MEMLRVILGITLLVATCRVSADAPPYKIVAEGDTFIELEEDYDYEADEVEIPTYNDSITYDTRQEIAGAVKLMKDINRLMTRPTANNYLVVTGGLGVTVIMKGLSKIGSVVGGVLDFLFPGPSNADVIKEIHRTFRILHNKMEVISSDIKRLERQIEWGNTQLRYSRVVDIIKTAVELDMQIRTSRSPAEKARRQERFVEHCLTQGLQNALNTLYDGVIGRGVFHSNILAAYYRKSRGHRPNIIKLGGRLVQLVTGGLLALMSYEANRRGVGGADDMARDYTSRMQLTKTATQNAFHLCNRNIGHNMLADARDWQNRNRRANYRNTAYGLLNTLRGKYDWKLLFPMVTNNVRGSSRLYTKGGPKVACMNCHKKHVQILFIDRKRSSRVNVAKQILERHTSNNAKRVCDGVDRDLRRRRIGWQFLFALRNRGGKGVIIYYRTIAATSNRRGTLRMVVLR